MRDTFTFNSITSSSFGVYVLDAKVNNAPEKIYDTISIDGRNGDLHIDRHRYANIEVPYTCAITEDGDENIDALIAALMAAGADSRLSDTIHPEYFRKATFRGKVEPVMDRRRSLAVFTLTFDCAPQKWLTSGETAVSVTGTKTINNPTLYASKPRIGVTGTGSFGMGSQTVTITSNPNNRMIIDCETQDVYDSSTYANMNAYVTLSSGEFPTLPAGNSTVTVSGVSLSVVPRWWTI